MLELDLPTFRATPLIRQPFQYLIVPSFIKTEARAGINADFPQIERPGGFPLHGLAYGPAFAALIETLEGPDVQAAFAEKFEIDLSDRPILITVRGRSGPNDGRIHTDMLGKMITVLIYMHSKSEASGAHLRLLRTPDDIDDALAEVPPIEGTLVAFRRSSNSYHGHKRFIGPRRVIQLNWMTNERVKRRELMKLRASVWFKRLIPFRASSRAA